MAFYTNQAVMTEETGTLNFRDGDPVWDVHYGTYDPDPESPICIVVPGYRSRGWNSPGNQKLLDRMQEKGMSYMAFDYGGWENQKKNVDPATMDTHIEETRAIMDLYAGRPHILIARSYAINVALATANKDTHGIVSPQPVPDFYQTLAGSYFKKHPLKNIGSKYLLASQGFYCWKSSSQNYTGVEFVKITDDFIKSTRNNTLSHIFDRNPSRPDIHLIANDEDRTANPEATVVLHKELKAQGYDTTTEIVDGEPNHNYSDETYDAVINRVQLLRDTSFSL